MRTSLVAETPAVGMRLQRLRRRLELASPLLVSTAAARAGHEAFVRAFAPAAHGRWDGCYVGADPGRSSRHLVDAIVRGLGLDCATSPLGVRVIRLTAHLRSLAGRGRFALILVDEAQRFSVCALGVLTGLTAGAGAGAGVRVLMLGQSALAARLEAVGARLGRLGLVERFDLPSFDREEIEDYLRLHLDRARPGFGR